MASPPTLDIPDPFGEGCRQHTPRRDPRTLCRWLAGALPGGAEGVDVLIARLRGELVDRQHLAAAAMVVAHLRGDLKPHHWARLTGIPDAPPEVVDGELDAVWQALATARLVRPRLQYQPRGSLLPPIVLRWLRFPQWSLASQDEDLLLMRDELVPCLLAGAALPGVAKADYAREIVGHNARDSAGHAVQYGAGLAVVADRCAAWSALARQTGAAVLGDYLGRLASYSQPGPVTRDRAWQMLVDLARCYLPTPGELWLREVEGGWVGPLLHVEPACTVRIDRPTGGIEPVRD